MGGKGDISAERKMTNPFARRLKGDIIDAYSAGIEKHGLNPYAVKIITEIGIDISGHIIQNCLMT